MVFVTEKLTIFFVKATDKRFMSDVEASGPIQFLSLAILSLGSLACPARFIVLHRNFRYP